MESEKGDGELKRYLLIGGAVLIALFFIGAITTALEEEVTEPKSNPPIESEDTATTVDVDEIYHAVKLGMSEDEVRAVAGAPNMVSTSEIEGFGTMRDLIYVGGFSDNVSILLEDGTVRVIIVGHVNSTGDLDTKTKM